MESDYLPIVIILLASAIILVSAAVRVRIGPILGYMAAGLLIGPTALGIVERNEITEALAELGVVFLLFTIGLDLPVARLKSIGTRIFVIGFLQIAGTGALIALIAWLFTESRASAVAIGAAVALSSTAIVARLLTDKGLHHSRTGRTAIAILLIQDLALGPLLVMVLALGDRAQTDLTMTMITTIAKGVVAVAVIWFAGRLLLERAFSYLAATKLPDLFSALTLLTLLAISAITHAGGLSLGFGGFLAGMLLADTQYRHQIAADIKPFRGLLLGLFFITIGMRIELDPSVETILAVIVISSGILVGKALIITGLAIAAGLAWQRALHVGLLLAQGGEFAFVILGKAAESGLMIHQHSQILFLSVIVTMALTPVLAWAGGKVEESMPDFEDKVTPLEDMQEDQELHDHVIIAGFGRVGRQIAKDLERRNIAWVAVDTDVPQVRSARRAGQPVHYADITHPEVVAALHVETARGMVVAFNDGEQAIAVTSMAHYIFPDLPIAARAHDEEQAERIRRAGAMVAIPEVLDTGRHLLTPILEPGPGTIGRS